MKDAEDPNHEGFCNLGPKMSMYKNVFQRKQDNLLNINLPYKMPTSTTVSVSTTTNNLYVLPFSISTISIIYDHFYDTFKSTEDIFLYIKIISNDIYNR